MGGIMDLYEILIPATFDGERKIPISYHRGWDEQVRAISKGLTILNATIGEWVSPDGELFREKMIPVRILANEREIDVIADLSAKYYNQKAIMYYKISNRVYIKHY